MKDIYTHTIYIYVCVYIYRHIMEILLSHKKENNKAWMPFRKWMDLEVTILSKNWHRKMFTEDHLYVGIWKIYRSESIDKSNRLTDRNKPIVNKGEGKLGVGDWNNTHHDAK